MPSFEITSPDGRKFRVDAPEGATQDDVLAYAQANMGTVPKPETEDPGALRAAAIGGGRVFDRLAAGLRQAVPSGIRSAVDVLGNKLGMAQPPSIDPAEQAANTAIYSGLQEKQPLATTLGEIAPLIAGLPAVGGIGSAAMVGALPGALEYGTPEERAMRAGLGAAGGGAGAGIGKAIGRVVQPFRPQASASQQAAQAAAERLGVQLRPGEITGSRPLRWAEAALNDLPFAGGMAQGAEAARTAAINAAGARSLGQTAKEITPDVLAQARTDIGGVFDTLLANRKIELGPQFRADMQKIVDSKVMPALRDESVDAIIKPFQNLPAGKVNISGEWFQQNKTALDSAIRTAYTAGQNGKAQALVDFEDALMKAAKNSMNATEQKAFEAAQRQWASLRLLETGKVVEGGNIMPGRLDSALINRYKAAYKEGKITGELADIGALAQAYKPLPQSGTVPRGIYSGIAGGAAFASPFTTAAMMATPAVVQKFLQSDIGRKYLTQGLLEMTPEAERRLMQGGSGLLGFPSAAAIN